MMTTPTETKELYGRTGVISPQVTETDTVELLALPTSGDAESSHPHHMQLVNLVQTRSSMTKKEAARQQSEDQQPLAEVIQWADIETDPILAEDQIQQQTSDGSPEKPSPSPHSG